MRTHVNCRADNGAEITLPVLKQIPVRSTFMNDYDTCPRKALYRHRAELSPKAYRTPLEVGSIFHTIMAGLAVGYDPDEVKKRSINILLDEEERLHQMCNKHGVFSDGKSFSDVADELQKDFAMALVMALWAWKHDPIDFKQYKPIRVESELSAPVTVDGRTMKVIVQPDVIHEDTKGRIWWPDYKTSGRNLQNLTATMGWDVQKLLNASVIAQQYHPERLGGSIHIFVQRPTIRLKKDESRDEYMERVDKWYAEPMPAELKRCLKLKEPVDATLFEAPEFQAKLKEAAIASRRLPLLHKWPRRRAACFGMFESLCEFHRLCNSDPVTWHAKELDRFEVKPRRTEAQSWAWWRDPGSERKH